MTLVLRLLVILLAAASACSLDPIDLGDKTCPCGPGLVCDEAANRCVTSLGGDAGPSCEPLVTATDFVAAWATPNVIRWEWEPAGGREALLRYEIHIATRAEDLGTPSARVIGPDENPELADYVLVRTGGGDEVVTNTMTFDHAPEQDYVGQLVAIDRRLCEFRSPVDAIRTLFEADSILLFGSEPTEGAPLPGESVRVVEGEDRYLAHTPADNSMCTSTVCSENIKWNDMAIEASDIAAGAFMNLAFLEAVVANDTDSSSYYSSVWLQLDDFRIFRFTPFMVRAAPDYRTYQVPLRVLMDFDADAPLTRQDLQDATILQANVGGQWSRTSPDGPGTVRIRSLRIGY